MRLATAVGTLFLSSLWLMTPVSAADPAESARSAGIWQVQRGDTLYSIGRAFYPKQGRQQARLRKALVELNRDQFPGGRLDVLVIGARLRLPEFVLSAEAAPVTKPARTPVVAQRVVAPSSGEWRVKRGESLSLIAQRLAPGNKSLQNRIVGDLFSANPQAFAGGRPSGLAVGALLRLPSYLAPERSEPPLQVAVVKPVPVPAPVIPPVQHQPVKMEPVAKQEVPQQEPQGESVGRVVISTTELKARRDDGRTRSLERNSRVYNGDTLVTSEAGSTQVRMKDGALLSLKPATEFKIEEFHYDGSENGRERSFFRLLRGGFRTITGAVGHLNKANYRVATRVATIGIRGTHYGLHLCDRGELACKTADGLLSGLYGGVVDGSIAVENATGEMIFNNDEYFRVASANTEAESLLAPPGVVFDAEKPSQTALLRSDSSAGSSSGSAGDNVSAENSLGVMHTESDMISESQPQLVAAEVVEEFVEASDAGSEDKATMTGVLGTSGGTQSAGSAAVSAWTHINVDGQVEGVSLGVNNDETVAAFRLEESSDVEGTLTNAVTALGRLENSEAFLTNNDTVLKDIGQDSIAGVNVSWGRWDGSDWQAFSQAVRQDSGPAVHYVYADQVTTPSQLDALRNSNTTATYNYISGTSPTNQNGDVGAITTATANIDFGAMQVTGYTVEATFGSGANPGVMTANHIGSTSLSSAAMGGVALQGDYVSSSNGSSQSLSGSASVNLVGANAEGLISSFAMAGSGNTAYSGAFVATKQ